MNQSKVWFVTGASKGLGLAMVKRLLASGYRVAATSRKLASLEAAFPGGHSHLLFLTVDLTSDLSVREAIDRTVAHFGRLDVVVNNAGYGIYGSVEALSDAEFRQTMDVNFFGTVNVCRRAMPYLRAQRSGQIFNISSAAGYKGFGNSPSYAAGKFAVIGLSESLAAEVAGFGVKVTVVAPGFFRTSFLDKGEDAIAKNKIPEYELEKLVGLLRPMNGQQPGDPDKLAQVLIRVASMDQPPVHLLMGPDAYELVMRKREEDRAEMETWKELTMSTNFDDASTVDPAFTRGR